jgi:hypothetical protein
MVRAGSGGRRKPPKRRCYEGDDPASIEVTRVALFTLFVLL